MSENIYGNIKRLRWLKKNLTSQQSILEFGCGTGFMITIPLLQAGYDIYGIDIDVNSINYGKNIFKEKNLDQNKLILGDISDHPGDVDVIIASEVLEHLSDSELSLYLDIIKSKLKNNGLFLITIPNGYGWFEVESYLWFKLGLGKIIEATKIDRIIRKAKSYITQNDYGYHDIPSSLSLSPHLQRFTLGSIKKILREKGFSIVNSSGSVLFSGPFSHLLFTGISPITRLNNYLGELFPFMASGFYIASQVITDESKST